MKWLKKALITSVLAVVALGALAIGGGSLYLNSEPVRQRIVAELRKVLKMPISIEGVSITPWDGMAIRGFRIAESVQEGAPTFLDAAEIRAKVRLLPLLSNEVVLQEITVSRPKITGREREGGGLILPEIVTANTPVEEPAEDPRPEQAKGPMRPPPTVKLGSLKIEEASLAIADAQGKQRAALGGVSVRAALRPEGVAAGSIRIDSAQAGKLPPLAFLQSPFNFTADGIELPELSAEFAGGKLTGSASGSIDGAQPFKSKIKLMGVDLARLAPKSEAQFGGRLMMELEVKGEAANLGSLRGRGSAEISQGHLASTPLLQTLGVLLEVPELVNIEFANARAEFRLKGEDIRIDSLSLESQNFKLTASGSIKKFDRLLLDARLHVSPSLKERLPGDLARAFSEPGDQGWLSLPFDISGTLASPKTNLQKRLLRETAKGAVGNLLNDLLGSGDSQKSSPAEQSTGGESSPDSAPVPQPPLPLDPQPTPPAADPQAPTINPLESGNPGSARRGTIPSLTS